MKILFCLITVFLACSCLTVESSNTVEGVETPDVDFFASLYPEEYDHVLKVDVEEITLSKNDTGYPLTVSQRCRVLKVYKGDYPHEQITLYDDFEEIIYEHKFGTLFFFFNDEQKVNDMTYDSEFSFWKYHPKLEECLLNKLN